MKSRAFVLAFSVLLIRTTVCQTPAPAEGAMTIDDLRQYFAVMHMKEVDARGIQVQMQAQTAKLPVWWPSDVMQAMTAAMLSVDLPPLEYPFVKSCMSSADTQALIALFQTTEGQVYLNQATGAMVQAEAGGTSPADAKQQQVNQDKGVPMAALQHLTADQQARVLRLLKGNAVQCMNSGFAQASAAVGQTRSDLAKKVMQDHQDELRAAQTKYQASQSALKE